MSDLLGNIDPNQLMAILQMVMGGGAGGLQQMTSGGNPQYFTNTMMHTPGVMEQLFSSFTGIQKRPPDTMLVSQFRDIMVRSELSRSIQSQVMKTSPAAEASIRFALQTLGMSRQQSTQLAQGIGNYQIMGMPVLASAWNMMFGSGVQGQKAAAAVDLQRFFSGFRFQPNQQDWQSSTGIGFNATMDLTNRLYQSTYKDALGMRQKIRGFGITDMTDIMKMGVEYGAPVENTEKLISQTENMAKMIKAGMNIYQTMSKENVFENIMALTRGKTPITQATSLETMLFQINALADQANIGIQYMQKIAEESSALFEAAGVNPLLGAKIGASMALMTRQLTQGPTATLTQAEVGVVGKQNLRPMMMQNLAATMGSEATTQYARAYAAATDTERAQLRSAYMRGEELDPKLRKQLQDRDFENWARQDRAQGGVPTTARYLARLALTDTEKRTAFVETFDEQARMDASSTQTVMSILHDPQQRKRFLQIQNELNNTDLTPEQVTSKRRELQELTYDALSKSRFGQGKTREELLPMVYALVAPLSGTRKERAAQREQFREARLKGLQAQALENIQQPEPVINRILSGLGSGDLEVNKALLDLFWNGGDVVDSDLTSDPEALKKVMEKTRAKMKKFQEDPGRVQEFLQTVLGSPGAKTTYTLAQTIRGNKALDLEDLTEMDALVRDVKSDSRGDERQMAKIQEYMAGKHGNMLDFQIAYEKATGNKIEGVAWRTRYAQWLNSAASGEQGRKMRGFVLAGEEAGGFRQQRNRDAKIGQVDATLFEKLLKETSTAQDKVSEEAIETREAEIMRITGDTQGFAESSQEALAKAQRGPVDEKMRRITLDEAQKFYGVKTDAELENLVQEGLNLYSAIQEAKEDPDFKITQEVAAGMRDKYKIKDQEGFARLAQIKSTLFGGQDPNEVLKARRDIKSREAFVKKDPFSEGGKVDGLIGAIGNLVDVFKKYLVVKGD